VKAKIIQIASTDTGLYALASDGTIWEKYVGEWVEVDQPPLADPEDELRQWAARRAAKAKAA
jgi:hypothetical protein